MKLLIAPALELTFRFPRDEHKLANRAMEAISRVLEMGGMRTRLASSGPVPVRPGSPELTDEIEFLLRVKGVRMSPRVALMALERAMNAEIPKTFSRIRREANAQRRNPK